MIPESRKLLCRDSRNMSPHQHKTNATSTYLPYTDSEASFTKARIMKDVLATVFDKAAANDCFAHEATMYEPAATRHTVLRINV